MPHAKLATRNSSAKPELELPFRIPAKDWFSLREAAALCGMGETFIESLYDRAADERKGELFGHSHNAGTGKRMTKRVPRLFVLTYLAKTATYDNEALINCLVSCLQSCSRTQQTRVLHALQNSLRIHS